LVLRQKNVKQDKNRHFFVPFLACFPTYNLILAPMQAKKDFIHVERSEPHRVRTKEILKEVPDMRKLIGKNPLTFWAIIGLVAFNWPGVASGRSIVVDSG
jgi:predicted RNA-binding protein YlqC (UPF0109 family)